MTLNLLITKEQEKIILKESINDELSDIIKKSNDFVKNIIEKVSKQIGFDLQFSVTWGATIGGLIGPISNFVKGKFPEINDIELSLLLTGVIANYFFDNQKLLKELKSKIDEYGLSNEFKTTLRKAESLKRTFLNFIESLNVTLHKVTNIMSYAFIIPIIPIIYDSVNKGVLNPSDAKELTIRLMSFGTLSISGVVLKEVISKIIERFKT